MKELKQEYCLGFRYNIAMKKIIVIFCVVMLAACAATSKLQPAEINWPAMQQKVPGASFEDVKKGFQLYKVNCSACHNLYSPDKYSINQWDKNLFEMIPKAKLNNDTVTQRLIRTYLHAGSK